MALKLTHWILCLYGLPSPVVPNLSHSKEQTVSCLRNSNRIKFVYPTPVGMVKIIENSILPAIFVCDKIIEMLSEIVQFEVVKTLPGGPWSKLGFRKTLHGKNLPSHISSRIGHFFILIKISNWYWVYTNNTSLWLSNADCNHSDCE